MIAKKYVKMYFTQMGRVISPWGGGVTPFASPSLRRWLTSLSTKDNRRQKFHYSLFKSFRAAYTKEHKGKLNKTERYCFPHHQTLISWLCKTYVLLLLTHLCKRTYLWLRVGCPIFNSPHYTLYNGTCIRLDGNLCYLICIRHFILREVRYPIFLQKDLFPSYVLTI